MDRPHPLGVAGRQVVVDGHQVHPVAAQGVQVGGHGGDQGLALTGLHLGHPALVQGPGADDLDVIGTLAQHAPGNLPHHREGFGHQVVEALAPFDPLAEVSRPGGEVGVGQPLDVTFKRIHPTGQGHQAFQ